MPKRHEVFLTAKCLSNGQIHLVEGLNEITHYFNDGIVRHKPGQDDIHVEIIENEFAIIFNNKSDSFPWHGQVSKVSTDMMYLGKDDDYELILFVASYAETKEKMLEGFKFAFKRADELIEGAEPRPGETRVK